MNGIVESERPVIFLDIDGVMNSLISMKKYGVISAFMPESIFALNLIIYRTNAQLVISSAWRKVNTLVKINVVLRINHILKDAVDCTPNLDRRSDSGIYIASTRGEEIATWLDRYPTVPRFVILDDGADMDGLEIALVQIDSECGLTIADAEKAIQILGGCL